MTKNRVEAFSDGVLAIVITIMVLEMKAPPHADRIADLLPVAPAFLSYILSFLYLGIYWNNHHHLLHAAPRVTPAVMWTNLHLLFWLSLVPFVTAWMGENHFAPQPMALYGAVLLMAAVAYWALQRAIVSIEGCDSELAQALGPDWKGKVSTLAYAVAIPGALLSPWIAGIAYVGVAIVWLVPDRRLARVIEQRAGAPDAGA